MSYGPCCVITGVMRLAMSRKPEEGSIVSESPGTTAPISASLDRQICALDRRAVGDESVLFNEVARVDGTPQ